MKVDRFGNGRHVIRGGILPSGTEKISTPFLEVTMNMKMKMIAAVCVAFCGASAFAAAAKPVPTCDAANASTDGVTLLKTCTPDVTFYAAGATALKGAIQAVLATDKKVFDKSKPFVTINLADNTNAYAYYGYGAAGTAWDGKKVAVIVNGTNGSMAGVQQLLTALKTGSVEDKIDQKEYITIKLHTLADQKAGKAMPDADFTVNTASTLAPVVTLASTRVADFKTGWGADLQKVAHMAFSDVRPSEATPGQIAKWDPKAFPSETIAMQGFGIVVNTNLYKALQKRDIKAMRMASDCQDNLLKASCQPNVSTSDYTALITGKVVDAADWLGDATEVRMLTLNRRPSSSGTQAATQIRFAGQANYYSKLATGFQMAGSDTGATKVGTTVDVNSMKVKTNSGTSDLLKSIYSNDAGLSIGIASLDNKASSKLGPVVKDANDKDITNYARGDQTAFWVKLDGVSPDFKGSADTAFDSKYRTALQNGYSFVFEFQTLKSVKTTPTTVYGAIYNKIVEGLKDPAADLTGIAYIGATGDHAGKATAWTRGAKLVDGNITGGNANFPLNKY